MDDDMAGYLAGVDPMGQGIDDHAKGQPHTACPYPAGSAEAEAWSKGWEHGAQADGIANTD